MCRKQKLPGPPAAHTALHSMPRADCDGSCVQGNGRKSCVCRVVPFASCALLIRRSSCCCFAFFIILNTVLLFPLLFTGDSYSYFLIMYLTLDFPSGAVIKKNHLPMQESQETGVQSLDRQDPLEEEMATHSSILAWRIPWTEEPGGPRPRGHKESDTMEHAHDGTFQKLSLLMLCFRSSVPHPVVCLRGYVRNYSSNS